MDTLIIDGAYGEGGGQILRTTLSLAVITGRPVRLEHIRARRKNPGLAAQHLTAVRAAAELCAARVRGAELGSQTLDFVPGGPARAGSYTLDVAQARQGGSAGAIMLVVQTVLLPLALLPARSTVTLRGGTHVPMSPSYDYVHDVWLPTLARMGVKSELMLRRSGWYPLGQGEVQLHTGAAQLPLRALCLLARGPLEYVSGRALATNLPAHVAERMAARATQNLAQAGIPAHIEPLLLKAACPGAGLFLSAHYRHCLAGFTALGHRGKPAETVADEACCELLRHRASGAAVESHLADQLILPAALCTGTSLFDVASITPHLISNAWVVERFGLAKVDILAGENATGRVRVIPSA